jgi:hypothetical protein
VNSQAFNTTNEGINVEVSAYCSDWEKMQKFLSDFNDTLQKGNNGETQRSSKS